MSAAILQRQASDLAFSVENHLAGCVTAPGGQPRAPRQRGTPALLPAVLALLVGQRLARDGNDANELLQPCVVAWAGGVEGETF
jgi:hypothetical protein